MRRSGGKRGGDGTEEEGRGGMAGYECMTGEGGAGRERADGGSVDEDVEEKR